MGKFRQGSLKFKDDQKVYLGTNDDHTIYGDSGELYIDGVAWSTVSGAEGTTDHSALNNLDYATAGHTGFQISGDYATNTDLATVSGLVDDNTVNIAQNVWDIAVVSGTTDTNTDDIAQLEIDLATLSGSVDDNTALIATTSGSLQTQIDNKDNYVSWSFAVDGVTKDAITSGDILDFVSGPNITITRSDEDKITISGSEGVADHSLLDNLDYASAGHTGFQPAGDYATNTDLATVSGMVDTNTSNLATLQSDFTTHSGTANIHTVLDDAATGTTNLWSAEKIIAFIAQQVGGQRAVWGGGHIGTGDDTIDYLIMSILGNAVDFGNLTLGREWLSTCSNGAGNRGVWGGGGCDGYRSNVLDYITISTPSNAVDFGDLLEAREYLAASDNGTGNRGVFAGGGGVGEETTNLIEYITISTLSNSVNFGELLQTYNQNLTACSNDTGNRVLFAGGYTGSNSNVIQYVTITSTGNAVDFGDLNNEAEKVTGTSNGTNGRGVFSAGDAGAGAINVIDYVTIATTGNATNFGDLTAASTGGSSTSNKVNNRGLIALGYTDDYRNFIDYITISTPGNASDFGDLTVIKSTRGATSNA